MNIVTTNQDEPGAQDDCPRAERAGNKGRNKRKANQGILTVEQCLRTLSGLPTMIAMGMLSVPKANAIKSACQAILQQHGHERAQGNSRALEQEQIVSMVRDNPELVSLLEPFMSDEQVEAIMKAAREGTMLGKLDFCRSFVHLDGPLISFDDRPYLPAIYGSSRRNLVIRASRQVEKSTFLVNTILNLACMQPGIHILFVCPRREQAQVFSRDRLDPVLEQSPILRRTLLDGRRSHMRVMSKQFANGSQLSIRAAFLSADSSRGLSCGALLVDEYQDIAAGHLPILQETLSHAKNALTILTGTPKSVDNHLETMFRQSTANEWTLACPGCSKGVILDERSLGPHGIICPDCTCPLDPKKGMWVPRNPESQWGDGFGISHPMVPWLNHHEILERQRVYDPVRFKNEVLGLPTALGDHIITRAEIETCCQDYSMAENQYDIPPEGQDRMVAGLDWSGGVKARTVLVIGYMQADYRFRICRIDQFPAREDFDRVLELVASRCRALNVRWIMADGCGTGIHMNRLLAEKLQGLCTVYGIIYSVADHAPRQDGALFSLTVNRSGSIGALFGRIKKQTIIFPRLEEVVCYLDEFVGETAVYDEQQRSIKYIAGPTQPDDALHATNYALLGAIRAHHPEIAWQ